MASNGVDPPLANPGDMQLYNFYKPSLVAGTYTITTAQTVSYTQDQKTVTQRLAAPVGQTFDVVAPQFSIDPKDIHSTYPPPGHADQPMILPHIVLNDPHLPWERLSSPTFTHNPSDQSILPWLAVLPFDPQGPGDVFGIQELRLSDTQLNGSRAIFKSKNSTPIKQSLTFTVTMTVAEYLKLPDSDIPGSTPVHIPNYAVTDPRNTDFKNIQDLDTPVQVIFITGILFRQLFCSRTDATKVDLDPYKYCAHVRNINTEGMGQAGVEDKGIFSVIHSRRSGPTDIAQNTAPRPQVVHLLSLEFIADMTDMPNDTDLVALISLYSWSYLCQPPLNVNFVDCLHNIGSQVKDTTQSNLLRPTESFINGAMQKVRLQNRTDLQHTISKRMHDGYTFIRHRLGTGEQAVAYFRGALTPNPASPASFLNWPVSSNNGQDYQILDPKQGIMDITYSSAWQLGRTMAISDFGFAGALMRFRRSLHVAGVKSAAAARAAMANNIPTKHEIVSSLNTRLAAVSKASTVPPPLSQVRSAPINAPVNLPERFNGPDSGAHPQIKKAFSAGVASAAATRTAAIATPPSGAFDEILTTAPADNDWNIILSWIGDRMWLKGIPTHYLVPDAGFLPPESIRFFHVDSVWMDCFIDGALSVANHLARETDPVRQEIKNRIKLSTGTIIGSGGMAHKPQVPVFGFFLRSAAVAAFPDMRIEVPYTTDKTRNESVQGGRLPILVRKQFAKDITMCLLDRIPTGGQIASIKISQPVHQQCFSVGDFLDANSVEFMFRKIYRSMSDTDATTQFLHEMGSPQTWKLETRTGTITGPPSIYDWNSRCLQLDVLNDALFGAAAPNGLPVQLPDEWGPAKGSFALDSSIAGLQLNDTIVYLEMIRPEGVTEIDAAPLAAPPRPAAQAGPSPKSVTNRITPQPLVVQNKSVDAAVSAQNLPAAPHLKPVILLPATRRTLTNVPIPLAPPKSSAAPSKSSVAGPSSKSRAATSKSSAGPGQSLTGTAKPPAAVPKSSAGPSKSSVKKPMAAPPPSSVQVQPQFVVTIFPSTISFKKVKSSFVLVDTPYDCDLVFSVVLPSALAQTNLFLSMIAFQIPIGDEVERVVKTGLGQNLRPGPGLIPDHTYESLSARMLSNQRWVVHIDPVPPFLMVRLLPRTTNRTMPLLQNKSLSFQLNGVPLAGANGDKVLQGQVVVNVQEFYTAPGKSGTIKDGLLQGKPQSTVLVDRKVGFVASP